MSKPVSDGDLYEIADHLERVFHGVLTRSYRGAVRYGTALRVEHVIEAHVEDHVDPIADAINDWLIEEEDVYDD